MSSVRSANLNKSILLVILMITMTQVGYLESMNPWTNGEETLDQSTDVLETGGQGSANYSLGQSTYGEAFALNTAIEPITFEYRENSDAATIYGNGSLWTVNQPSNFIGRRIANGNGNFSVGDGVFFFDNGSCAISMHNTSNGTTWEAFSISPCSDSWSSSVFVRESFFVSGEHFLFQLYDGSSSEQIWAHNISNGTSWRIGGGAFSDTSGYLRSQDELFQHGNDFWFWGFESGSRSQLYRINGSTMEVEVRSNFTDSCGAYPCSYSLVKGWAASNGSIYFIAKSTAVGHKAYFHDIATNQTSLAFDINPSGSGIYGLMQVSDDLLFVNGRNTSSSGLKLWAHNTTTNQTYLQSDITPSLPRLDIGATNPLIDDVYYFYATNTSTGNELHAYSIVNNSTWLVEDIQPGSVGSLATNTLYPPLQAYEGKLFILADDGTNGDQVWVHDPSTAETYRLTNLGVDVDNIQRLVGDTLYFSASKMGYSGYLYAHSMSTNSTYEVPNFPDGRYYQTGTRFFLPVNGTIYMNGGHGPATNSNAWTPIQALVAWSPSEFTPMTTPVAGATCSVSSTLPSGLALNQGNCTVSGTPTVVTPQSNYTITATINGQTYGATFSLITDYLPMRPSVAELEASIGVAITNISFGGFGEPGDGGYGEPVNYNYQSIYAGHDGYCFILETGELRCDGNNYIEGQGNIAAVTGEFVEPSLPADAVVKHVLPGASSHVCAILVNGSLYCWGGNYYGQLGNGNYNAQYTPVHIPLPTGRTVEKISADHEFTCALLDNGSIMCWGRNHEGQLGRGTTATSGQNSPGYVSILPQGRHAVDVGVGSEHVCALLDNNDVVCWGSNNSMTGSSSITVPHTVPFPSNQSVLSIAAIGKVSCALMDNGSVRCWGSNAWYHALGVTGASTTGTPTLTATMPGGLNATALIAHHDGVCATLENFSIACWGAIQYTHVVEPTIPSFPYGSMQITSFAASYNKACYALENGSLWCGNPSTGAGDFIDIESPIQSSLPTLISGATCSISPPLPSGLSLTQGTCKIIGTPTALASNQTYAVFANTTEGTYRGEVNIAVVGEPLYPSVEGAELILDEAMTNITFQYNASAASGSSGGSGSGGMTNVTGATCTVSPSLPTGLSIDSSTCTISGTPTVATSNTTYTVTANISNVTYQGSVWLSTSTFGTITSAVEGAHLNLGEAMTPLTLNYTVNANGGVSTITWETHPALPAGMSISGGTISGTPSVYATNQTYTIYANQSGYSTTHELYFSVDTDNAHTVVENQAIDAIGFHPPFNNGTTAWTVSPALPGNLSINTSTGEITGTVNGTRTNTTYTVTATHSGSGAATETFSFNLQSLADYDGDGLANDLPSDYDAAEGPTPGLVADDDDDADGLLDTVETNTGTYVDSSDTGTDPLNPDTDGDGICDGPLAVPGVCIAGPDTISGATVVDTPIVLLNNSDVDEVAPFYPVTTATYGLSPSLPTSIQFDASNGSIWGTPDMTMANTTYTMWANLTDGTSTSWTFFLEVLEDLDGDGMPDVLPSDYNATNDPIRTPGLEEDLDDDGDGYNDTAETDTGLYLDLNNTGTDPRDPDTDDDGICDGPGTVPGVCTAGPDLTPFGTPATVVAVNNSMIPSVPPYYAGSGLTYEVMPDLPAGLTIDPTNGYLMGIPTETIGNTTFTVYANHSDGTSYSWDFTIEVLEDSDGDGSPDTLPSDYDGDNDSIRAPPGLTEDLDDDNDGASDLDEIANGTEPLNPDTDGDGFCDGINAVAGVCFAGPDPYPLNPNLPLDTDGDGLPDEDSAWTGPPYADTDDDNDGFPDVSEDACGSDPLDANSIPADMDGDTICDDADDDKDGDGIDNVNETGELGVPPGSSPINPDTDGDGICDGPESPVTSNCTAGPDAFPLDPSAWEDTDGDGYPNDLYPPSTSVPPLEEDTDDDNDGWSDIDEVNCGSDPLNATDMPVDLNGDGVCDALDPDWDDDGIPNANETDTGVYNDSSDMGTDPWNPDTDGDGFCDGPFAVSNETEMICVAGPDPFPLDPTLPLDTDGDGLPNELPEGYIGNMVADEDDDNDGYSDVSEINCVSDPLDATSTPTNDLDGDGICDAEDSDVDGDGLSNETELAEGSLTSYMNADTDGDGVCDGPSAPALPAGICVAGPDAFPDDPAAWLDTDGDGDPDEIVDGVTTDLVLDTDDDNDGWEDVDELACGTNSKDDMSTPFDGDDDGICDVLDTQTLGYTINGNESEMFEAYVNQSDFILMPNLTGMEPGLWTIEPALPAGLSFSGTARSGETGIITGIPTEASPMTNYTVMADNGRVSISFTFGLGVLNDTDGDRLPDELSLTGLETDLDDDNDGHLDEIELKCGSDPLDQTNVPNVDEEGNCIEGKYAEDDSDDSNGFLICLIPFCFILLLALLLFGLLFKDKVLLMGPEPENTTSDPAFLSGAGTKDDPFVLKPIKALKAGSTVEAKETISIINMSPEILVNLLDLAESANDKRFRMYEVDGSTEEPGFNLEADDEGRLRLRFVFDDSDDPTYPGGTYDGLLKLGKASVYLSWTVEVKEDKRKMNQIRKEQEAAEKAEKEAKEAEEKAKAEAEAKEAEEKAKAEAEEKAAEEKAAKEAEKKAKAEEKAAAAALAKKEKEDAAAKKKEEAAAKKAAAAEEMAAKEAEEAEAKAKAEADAKAAEEKAAKEAEAKAKADEKAAAAAAAKKAKEEEEAKKKAEAEAKAAEEKAAKEAEAKAKAEAAAKKKVEKKPAATKEAKKQEELQRVKKRAKSIDFKVIGESTSTELKSEVKKGAKTLEVGNASEFADSGSAAITDSKGSTLISWTGKDGNVLTGVTGVTRVFGVASVVMVKDDLQVIKGIGPFIEEKLNALGITTYRQLANMNAKLEKQVNEAIEFFPGRVKRDQWVAQAKILLGEDVKLDEKALKQAEELERIAQKAEGIDFGILGVASASEADDLQKIKGIGPFIAEKLNALGIYKFSQLANMTSEIEEEVNVAIEFFPGRVKRDEWAKQAKELAKN